MSNSPTIPLSLADELAAELLEELEELEGHALYITRQAEARIRVARALAAGRL